MTVKPRGIFLKSGHAIVAVRSFRGFRVPARSISSSGRSWALSCLRTRAEDPAVRKSGPHTHYTHTQRGGGGGDEKREKIAKESGDHRMARAARASTNRALICLPSLRLVPKNQQIFVTSIGGRVRALFG